MEYTNDKDYKYVIQDTGRVYLGARMTFREMMEWEDVPFKLKAIVNRYFLEEMKAEEGFAQALQKQNKDAFAYQVCKQLKVKIKGGFWVEKTGRKGEVSKRYQSKVYSLDEYIALTEMQQEMIVEEISFSKLALLAFSV